jgi:hypothetical protein
VDGLCFQARVADAWWDAAVFALRRWVDLVRFAEAADPTVRPEFDALARAVSVEAERCELQARMVGELRP